jgi:Flp pilus assembly protein TadG
MSTLRSAAPSPQRVGPFQRGAMIFPQFFTRFAEDDSGVSAILVGLCLAAILGAAGLAVDVGLWYADRRAAQGAADAAAYSAAVDYANSSSPSVSFSTASAKAVAAKYGFVDGTGGVAVTVNSPPKNGSYTSGTYNAFEVIITKSESLFLSSLFLKSASVSARAVSVPSSSGQYCMEILNSTPGASNVNFIASNGDTINMPNCGIADNGPGSCAINMSGGATLSVKNLAVVGNYCTSNGATVSVSGIQNIGSAATPNPYSNLSVSTVEGSMSMSCSQTGASYSGGSHTLSPGVYCNGLGVYNSASVTLNPGVYYVVGGSFSIQASSVTGSGVTIILTGSASSYATANIADNATLTLTAPTSGPTAGVAIWADGAGPTSNTSALAGGATMNITGALYFPTQTVSFSNGASNASTCTQLIAYDVNLSGGGSLSNKSCVTAGAKPIGGAATTLDVE